jgi:FKBP-type peptidyl-prolyl cis-trans isomerase
MVCFSTLLFLAGCSTTQDTSKGNKKEIIKNRSYAYGAMVSQGIKQMGLSKEERNADKFIEGLKVGIKGDKEIFKKAQGILQKRMETKVVSADEKAGGEIAYNLGLSVIGGLATEVEIPASDFNFKVLKKSFLAAEAGDSLTMDEAEMNEILQAYFEPINKKYQAKIEENKKLESVKNIAAGKEFLAKNAKKESVVTMENGMQYEIITPAKGPKPTIADRVKTHYHGTLINGDVFDSSVDRGEPASFPLNGVIKGWQEGIPLMSVGAKYRFYIPENLAYGEQSPSPKIPASSTLIFEVELLEIEKTELQRNIEAGNAFLAENGKKKGVVTLPSGLQYLAIVEGSGPKARLTDRVKVHYHGTLIDGTVFDSSVDRGAPATFGVNQVVKGWQEGIPLRSEGAKYRLFIPAHLAYGNQGAGAKIKGGSTLIFDVELLEIEKTEVQKNIEAGNAFLAENGKKQGVVTLPSGLQYLRIIEGSGPNPTLRDRVKVHYHGTLSDGTVFDSSVNRGKPATFGVNQVIKGWQEGIPLMSAGAKYRLFIPSHLAYGNQGTGPKIKGGSTLIFDVELFEINPK